MFKWSIAEPVRLDTGVGSTQMQQIAKARITLSGHADDRAKPTILDDLLTKANAIADKTAEARLAVAAGRRLEAAKADAARQEAACDKLKERLAAVVAKGDTSAAEAVQNDLATANRKLAVLLQMCEYAQGQSAAAELAVRSVRLGLQIDARNEAHRIATAIREEGAQDIAQAASAGMGKVVEADRTFAQLRALAAAR
jgi:hypothetical protein